MILCITRQDNLKVYDYRMSTGHNYLRKRPSMKASALLDLEYHLFQGHPAPHLSTQNSLALVISTL